MATAKEMKWAITGGSGQLAQSLSESLAEKGANYVTWDHNQIDITDSKSLETICDFQPDVLVNCAAWTNVDGAEDHFEKALKVNCDGAKNVAIVAKNLNIPLVHISTDYVFAGERSHPWLVTDSTKPTTKYGISKLLGEQKIQDIWPEKSYILRTAWLYGPHGRNFAKTILKKLLSSSALIEVVNDQMGQPTTTPDLAEHIQRIVYAKLPSGIYHATNSGQATWWEFAAELALLSKSDVTRVVPVSSNQIQTKANRPKYSVLDHSLWDKVGVDPMRSWRDALEDVFPGIQKNVTRELTND